ncbi:MAG TPA: translesion DNA synthesis-associated protein ImuA [Rubrivivax sp.]|nr:translesion DNA synthesis-associated protein ImuA [Rubrivivax sp.]
MPTNQPPLARAPTAVPAALEALHPALWRAHQLGRLGGGAAAVPTGFAALDAELPGGGWPCRVLTELLLPHPGCGEMRLLAPALARLAAAGRPVMLFDPPALPCAPALAQLGVPADRLVVVHGRDGPHGARQLLASADLLWALEQALASGQAGAVLAWPPRTLRADALRRLQLAAQAHDGPAFVLRGVEQRERPSPAPLRLALRGAGIDTLAVRVLKRRGPPLAQPLRLALAPVLAPVLRARAEAARSAGVAGAGAGGGPPADAAAAVAPGAAPAGGGAAAWPPGSAHAAGTAAAPPGPRGSRRERPFVP